MMGDGWVVVAKTITGICRSIYIASIIGGYKKHLYSHMTDVYNDKSVVIIRGRYRDVYMRGRCGVVCISNKTDRYTGIY